MDLKPFKTSIAVWVIIFAGSSLFILFSTGGDKFTGQPCPADKTDSPTAEAASDTRKKAEANRPDHSHPAFSQRRNDREKMVKNQISARGVRDPNVVSAMLTVPRHSFVRKSHHSRAYGDHPLPIGLGQTISQPYIVAYMTEKLQLEPNSRVLEIGTGSGYQAAVCAEIAKDVYTIEILKQLAQSAKERLEELGYSNIEVKNADGYFGWPEKAPFDCIIVTAATGIIPPALIAQLKTDGKMILPLGSPYGNQVLVLITKTEGQKLRSRRLLPVRFVPMLGEAIQNGK